MAQKFYNDKITSMTHSAGTLTLGAGSILTIGGQQYTLSSNVNVALPSLAASQLYMVYAIVTNGVVSIVSSTNFNSTGPTGALSYKLVGAYVSTVTATFGDMLAVDSPVIIKAICFPGTSVTINTSVEGFVDTSNKVDPYGIVQVPSGAYTSSTGLYATTQPRFVNPIPGAIANIDACLGFTVTTTNVANNWNLVMRKNGGSSFNFGANGAGANAAGPLNFQRSHGVAMYPSLIAGDYLEIRGSNNQSNIPTYILKSTVEIVATKAFKDM